MEKIQMKTPLVEMDGDEMTRVLWRMIKDELICPFVDLKTEYYDLGLLHRNETRDQVTADAALATKKYGVAVKCATITPNAQRMVEYPQLTEMWKSPNGTIRSILDGTVFRAPILLDSIKPVVRTWKKPITIARHAYGDVYKSVSFETDEPGECTMTFKGASGKEQKPTAPPSSRVNTTRKTASARLRGPASNMLLIRSRIFGSPPRTPSQKSTTARSSAFLKRNMKSPTKYSLKRWVCGISTR